MEYLCIAVVARLCQRKCLITSAARPCTMPLRTSLDTPSGSGSGKLCLDDGCDGEEPDGASVAAVFLKCVGVRVIVDLG